MPEITIGRRVITEDSQAYLIAEIGNNHCGDGAMARRMVCEAAHAGADAVKFQRRTLETLYTRDFINRPYDSPTSYGPTYRKHREALELPDSSWKHLEELAESLDIDFIVTPFDIQAREFISRTLQLPPIFKIASAHITHHELIAQCVEFSQSAVLVSTGGASKPEILDVLSMVPYSRLCLLHATSAYPTADKHTYLGSIPELKKRYPECIVGYSNHNPHGPIIPAAAFAMGANVIEVHFTMDRSWKGTDHAMSFEPSGLAKLRSYLDRLHIACRGNKPDRLSCEIDPLRKMGHSLYASHPLKRGHVLTDRDIAIRSPAVDDGFPPYCKPLLVGSKAAKDMVRDECFKTSEYPTLSAHHARTRVG